MSAIVGVVGTMRRPEDRAWIAHALARLAVIAPDAQDVRQDARAALGHALLRTGEDGDEAQPLSFEGTVWLTAVARLDARDALRDALRAQGRRVGESASDAALVLHAWHAWGEQCVEHLQGDFAITVWDAHTGCLFCARDHFGTAPLHYAVLGDRLLVGTALDTLLLHPDVPDDFDDAAIADRLLLGMDMDPARTVFAAIHRLPPAHTLTWSDGRVAVRRYWDGVPWEGFTRLAAPADYAEQFREHLAAAVADRVRAPRVTTQLSGGMDSTSVAALACRAMDARGTLGGLRAQTASVAAIMHDDEADHAAVVAAQLGIPLDRIDVTAYPDLDPLVRPALRTPEPTLYLRTGLERAFVQRAATHGRVALTGLGGDSVLLFEPTWALDWLARGQVRRVAGAVREQWRLFRRPPRTFARAALRTLAWRARRRQPIAPWIAPALVEGQALRARARRILSGPDWDSLGRPGAGFWAGILAAGDPSVTGTPLEFRHPFLDLRVLRFAVGLPPVPWLVRKQILRDAMAGLLPEHIRQRPKTPLAAHPTMALAEKRGTDARLLRLVEETPDIDRWLDRAALRAVLESPTRTDVHLHRPLAGALGLAHWRHHWTRPTPADVPPTSRELPRPDPLRRATAGS